MGAENGAGIPNFSGETLSRSFGLAEKFNRSGAINGKQDSESVVRANVEVSKILNTSFSVGNVAETQVNAITNYESVSHMVEIVDNTGLTDRVRKNAENALYEVGLALSQNKDVLKAATEGRLGEVLVSNLNGIEPYLLSSYLTNGRDDTEGQKNVGDLVELFKLKKKADTRPDWYEANFNEKKKELFGKLFDACDEAGEAEVNNGTVGRLELMMGYITGIDEKSKTPVIVETVGIDEKFAAAADRLAETAEKLGSVIDRFGEMATKEKTPEEKESLVDRLKAAVEASEGTEEGTPAELQAIYDQLIRDEEELKGDTKALAEKRKEVAKSARHWISGGVEPVRQNERSEYAKGFTVDNVFSMIRKIEDSGRESTDLTYNSTDARKLDLVVINAVEVKDENGNILSKDERAWLVNHIKMSLLANDWYLSASISTTVEDMVKMSMRIHQGDVEHTLDHDFLSHFLNIKERKTGLAKGFAIAEAWDLRQRAYFDYIGSVENGLATSGLLAEFWKKYSSYIQEKGMTMGEFLKADKPLLKKNEDFGVNRDYYTNLRMELPSKRGLLVKELMAMDLANTHKISIDNAKRSVEMARRLSTITYTDSLANIGFIDGDDYAELINFKLIRYADQVEAATGGKEGPKNKPTGFAESIKYIDSLTPSWLQTLLDKDAVNKKGGKVNSIINAADIDFDGMDSKSAMHYHLASIVIKKVLPVQQMFLKGTSPKDFGTFQDLQRKFDQLNKTITEAASKGWDLLNLEECGMTRETPLANKQRLFRALYVLSFLGIEASSKSGQWGSIEEQRSLERQFVENNFFGNDGKRSLSFMTKDQWKWIWDDRVKVKNWAGKEYYIKGFGMSRRLGYYLNQQRNDSQPWFGGGGGKKK